MLSGLCRIVRWTRDRWTPRTAKAQASGHLAHRRHRQQCRSTPWSGIVTDVSHNPDPVMRPARTGDLARTNGKCRRRQTLFLGPGEFRIQRWRTDAAASARKTPCRSDTGGRSTGCPRRGGGAICGPNGVGPLSAGAIPPAAIPIATEDTVRPTLPEQQPLRCEHPDPAGGQKAPGGLR